jgi:hypothetical protein
MIRMKNSLAVFIFCITILAAAGILGWGNRSQASPRVVWEYKIITTVNNAERTMNELGADGWEFVQFTKDHETSGVNGNYFFRRSK